MIDKTLARRNPSELRPHPQNTRNHPLRQIRRICASIKQFGFTSPVLVDEHNRILAGHARVLAAIELGLDEIPVLILRGLSETKKRAYILADNKLAEMAGYDRPRLFLELQDLSVLLAEDGLDFDLTGFDPAEFDALAADLNDSEREPEDAVPAVAASAVSRRSDLWLLGREHRLLCDDSRKADYGRLMGGALAAMVFADPPYNVSIPKTVGRGRTKHRNFAMASAEMSPEDFTNFLIESFSPAAEHSVDGALHYIFIDWRHFGEVLNAGIRIYGELLNVVVWCKTNGGQGSFYRSQHEEVFIFRVGSAPHQNNIQLGRYGRNRSNVWTYAGANTFRAGRMADLAAHPTVKPVALVADAIRDCTRRGDVVLDPFIGAGTTILAAERVGRRAFGIEIDPLYVDVAIRRWQAATKSDAILKDDGRTFDEIAADVSSQRRSAP